MCHAPSSSSRYPFHVLVVGAGPVGLTLANQLGFFGIRTLLVEVGDESIDRPRSVGMDDESLRAFRQAALVDEIRRHTVPNQIMRFVNGSGRLPAELDPRTAEFVRPRRNGFIQPLVDAELLNGARRFGSVDIRFGYTVRATITQGYAGVYSSFPLHAERAGERYGVPAHEILRKVGEAGDVCGQEDMTIDVALQFVAERERGTVHI